MGPLRKKWLEDYFRFEVACFLGDMLVFGGVGLTKHVIFFIHRKLITRCFFQKFSKWMFPRIGVPQNGWFIMNGKPY